MTTLSSQAGSQTARRPAHTLLLGGLVILLAFAVQGLIRGNSQERVFYGVQVLVFGLVVLGVRRRLLVAQILAVVAGLLVAVEQAAYVVADLTGSHQLEETIVDPILLLAALAVVTGAVAGLVDRRRASGVG